MNDKQSPPGDPQRRCLPTNPEELRYALDNLREFLQWIERHVGYLVSSNKDVLVEREARKIIPVGYRSPSAPDWPVLHERAFWHLLTEDERHLWGRCGEGWQHANKVKRGIRQRPHLGDQVDDLILHSVGADDIKWELRPYFAERALDSALNDRILVVLGPLMESLLGLEQQMVDALAKERDQKKGATKRRNRKTKLSRKPLTARQVEVVQIVGECKGNLAEAGRRLGIDRKTVSEHCSTAMKKLGKSATKHATQSIPNDRRGQANLSESDDRRGYVG